MVFSAVPEAVFVNHPVEDGAVHIFLILTKDVNDHKVCEFDQGLWVLDKACRGFKFECTDDLDVHVRFHIVAEDFHIIEISDRCLRQVPKKRIIYINVYLYSAFELFVHLFNCMIVVLVPDLFEESIAKFNLAVLPDFIWSLSLDIEIECLTMLKPLDVG